MEILKSLFSTMSISILGLILIQTTNLQAQCSPDITKPAVVANTTVTVNLNSSGNSTLALSSVENGSSDNCTLYANLLFSLSYNTQNGNSINFNCNDIGIKTVKFKVTDASGNFTEVNISVTVSENIAPTAIYNNNITKYLNSSGSTNISVSEIENGSTDNCTIGSNLTKKLSYSSQTNANTINFNCSDIGTKTVSYSVTDAQNNTSSVNVTVNVIDNIAPTIISNNNITKYLNSSGTTSISVSEIENGSTDNCTINSSLQKSLTMSSQSNVNTINFNCTHIGSNTITYTVKDASNNSTTKSITVIVSDNLPPTIVTNSNIKKYLNGSGIATLTISDIENGSFDNCTNSNLFTKNLTYSSQKDQSSIALNCNDLGTKSIDYKVIDAQGNFNTQTVSITVLDTISPTLNHLNNLTRYINNSGNASLSVSEIENGSTDNCTISGNLTKSLSFGNQNNVTTIFFKCSDRGNKTLTYKVVDASGNFKIKTIQFQLLDTVKPKLSVKSPICFFPNNGGIFKLTKSILDSTSFDNCNLEFSMVPSYLTSNNLGTNLIYVKGSDSSNNSNITYSSVDLRDTTRPLANCRDKITLHLNSYGQALLASEVKNGIGQDSNIINSIIDNCDKAPQVSLSKVNFSTGDLFTIPQIIKLTIVDKSGNQYYRDIKVTVKDTTSPKVVVKKILNFTLNNQGSLKILPNEIDSLTSDNAGSVKIQLDKDNFNCSDVGIQNIVFTATDLVGNISKRIVQVFIKHQYVYGTIYSQLNQNKVIYCKDLKTAEIELVLIGGTEPYNIVWKKDNSNLPVNNIRTLTNLGAGRYTANVKDANNCLKTDSIIIVEPTKYLPEISISNDSAICKGKTIKLFASGGVHYTWNNSNFLDYASSPTPMAYPSQTTTFIVKAINENNCVNFDSVKITVRELPMIKIATNPGEACFGNQLDLSVTGGIKYIWSPAQIFNNNALSSVKAKIFNHTSISVKGQDLHGCENIDSLGIKSNPLPVLTISIPDSICKGSNKQLSVSGASNYIWTGPNLNTNSSSSPIATPIMTSKYIVEGISNKNCKSKDSTYVFVINNPVASNIEGPNLICQNSNWIEYKVSNSQNLIREWSITNGTINYKNNDQLFTHWKFGNNGTIKLIEKSISYPYCSVEKTKNIQLSKNTALNNSEILIKANNVSSNILISTIQNSPIMIWGYESKSDFNEIITCQNSNWCKYPYIDTFRNRYWVKIGDSSNCLQKSYLNNPSYLSANSMSENQYTLYPNPTSSIVEISNFETVLSVNIYNLTGNLLRSTNDYKLDFSNYNSGTYIIEIINKDLRKSIHKISVIK